MLKSFFDRTLALFILALLAVPVFLPLWLAIRATSKGGAMYSQLRIGKDCRPFKLYKFRSMYAGSDKQGYQTQENDARITPIGRFLRKTSLDELPQLWNVLKGDMSLVGPRPDTPMQQKDYAEADWRLRHTVRPGITGLAQVNGRSNMSAEDRLAYDLDYARHADLRLDLAILLKTLGGILGKDAN